MNKGIFPLSISPVGGIVRLECIQGGEKIYKRLTSLGFTPGIELRVISNSGGPLLIALRDSRIAIGRGMANRLMVSDIH